MKVDQKMDKLQKEGRMDKYLRKKAKREKVKGRRVAEKAVESVPMRLSAKRASEL
jgi:hypothetical protein